MDRNSIIGIIIIAGIIIVRGVLSKPSKEELEKRKQALDSIRQVQQEQAEQVIIDQQQKDTLTETKEIAETLQEDEEGMDELRGRLGEFAEAGAGENEFYTLENDLIILTISSLTKLLSFTISTAGSFSNALISKCER